MSAQKLVSQVQDARACEDPHEGEMPLERSRQPSTQGQGLRNVHDVLLRNLGSKTGKGAENPQPAGDQNEDRNRVQPMAEAHHPGMLERRSDASVRLRGQAGRNLGRVARTRRLCGKRRLDAAGRWPKARVARRLLPLPPPSQDLLKLFLR